MKKDAATIIAPNHTHRIGEVARTIGVTTRTLRYWQEFGLIAPHGRQDGGERLYTDEDITRGQHIRELQNLFGFTLAEIKNILMTEDTLADIKTAYHADVGPAERRKLAMEALTVTTNLLSQIDDKVIKIKSYRNELANKVERLQIKIEKLR